jgi:WD domain, G-beta repeat
VGGSLATCGGPTTLFWDASAFEERSRVTDPHWQGEPYAHRQGVLSVAWSPDGRALASCGENGELWVWDGDDGHLLGDAGVAGLSPPDHAWHPDGNLLAVLERPLFGATRILVWDVTRASVAASVELPGEDAAASSLCWTPSGRFVVIAALDGHGGWMWAPESTSVQPVSDEEMAAVQAAPSPTTLEAFGEGSDVVVRCSGREIARARCLSRVAATQVDPDCHVVRVADDGSATGHRPIPYLFELRTTEVASPPESTLRGVAHDAIH